MQTHTFLIKHMNNSDTKFDWNDISIIPDTLSDISSRSEVNPYQNNLLPLFTAPMDMVINESNINDFEKNLINICLPRNIKYDDLKNDNYFYSYGLDEIIEIMKKNHISLSNRILIDTANANMYKLYDISKLIKECFGDDVELMIGNIANPETYRKYCEIGVDWCRVGVGGGSMCITSANTSIHYPMASLVYECHQISKEFDKPTKIIADGGFKNYSDIIKALALGSSAVMLGGIFNKSLESCGDTFMLNSTSNEYVKIDKSESIKLFNDGVDLYKYYRGMSTKEVQKSWNKSEIKTSEGIARYNKIEYKLSSWCENLTDYLKSAMSYSNTKNLNEFIGEAKWIKITQNAFNRYNK